MFTSHDKFYQTPNQNSELGTRNSELGTRNLKSKTANQALLVFSFFLISLFSTNGVYAQECNSALDIVTGDPFFISEENGEAYFQFEATTNAINIGFIWNLGINFPDNFKLFSGSCSNPAIIDSGVFVDPGDEMLVFRYSNLTIGTIYHFGFTGTSGYFEFNGLLTPQLVVGGTNNCASVGCNYFVNSSFDVVDPNITLPVGGKTLPFNNPNISNPVAFVNETCDWDLASSNQGNTPDYLFANPHTNYINMPCATSSTNNGNDCGVLARTGDGVIHMFSIDNRPNFNRREYIYTRLENLMSPNHIYYASFFGKHNTFKDERSTAFQMLFIENSLIGNIPVNYNTPIIGLGTPQVDFSASITNNFAGWQHAERLFQFNGTSCQNMVFGNFLSNAQTANFINNGYNSGNTNWSGHKIPSMYLDDFELLDLGGAGEDKRVCNANTTVVIGEMPFFCATPGVTYSWADQNGIGIGNTNTITVNSGPKGTTSTFTLTISYNGLDFQDTVAVITEPDMVVNNVFPFACSGSSATFQINNFSNNTFLNVASTGISFSSATVSSSGLVTVTNPQITGSNNFGTVTFSGTFSQATGIVCTESFTVIISECCANSTGSAIDYVFQPLSSMSAQLGTTNMQISNKIIVVAGTVVIDYNYTFDNCRFYFMPNAELILDPFTEVTIANSVLQNCDNYRWDGIELGLNSTLHFINNTLKGALRGIRVNNNTNLIANGNTFNNNYNSILFNGVTTSVHSLYNNNFVLEPWGFNGIIKDPNSTIPLASFMATGSLIYITGIAIFNNSNNIVIGAENLGMNTFNTTSPNSVEIQNEVTFIYAYNADFKVINNSFGFVRSCIWAHNNCSFTVGGSTSSLSNDFNVNYSLGAPLYLYSTGVLSNNSYGTIKNNTFYGHNYAISCSNLPYATNGTLNTEVLNNTIDAKIGIAFSNNSVQNTGLRIVDNTINAGSRGITLNKFKALGFDLGTPDKVFVSNNNITLSAPITTQDARKGIVIKECYEIYVGGNTVSIPNYTPTTTTKNNVIGIDIRKLSKKTQISGQGGNGISNFDYGLVMDNDNGTTKFSCLTFNDCRNAVYYKNITASNVQDVWNGSANSSMVVFNDGGLSGAVNRVSANSVPAGLTKVDWNWSGTINQDPTGGSNFSSYFSHNANTNSFNCSPLPSQKTNNTNSQSKNEIKFLLRPNPSKGEFILSSNTKDFDIKIFAPNGDLQYLNHCKSFENHISVNLSSGLYFLIIEYNGKTYHEKLVITD